LRELPLDPLRELRPLTFLGAPPGAPVRRMRRTPGGCGRTSMFFTPPGKAFCRAL